MQEEKNEHFIRNIEIKKFKCFEDFKAEGFGRVNLIGGKNNVGKTAFMEALYIFINSNNISNLLATLREINKMRYKTDAILDIIDDKKFSHLTDFVKYNGLSIENDLYKVFFNSQNKNGELLFKIVAYTEKVKELNKNLVDLDNNIIEFSHFIDIEVVSRKLLKNFYASIQLKRKEEYLNIELNKFDNSIKSFSFIGDDPMFWKEGEKEPIHLNEFGFGSKQLIYYIVALFAMQGKILFIDEIASGIHYTNLDKLWEIILTISKEQKVQVFATTHSKECIESYARVAKKLEDKEVTFIKMTQLKDGKIMAGVRDYDMLQYTIKDGHEVRGV